MATAPMPELNHFELDNLRHEHRPGEAGYPGAVRGQRCRICNTPSPCDVVRLLDEHQEDTERLKIGFRLIAAFIAHNGGEVLLTPALLNELAPDTTVHHSTEPDGTHVYRVS